ncbi:MAG: DarT ssDNA thymidine ADP-ribosyltransferase family protein [Arcicella sp.]|jgi:hypothetical protein|nr:DarT ssDNA thymidine ADP-ribosyltransferase family protein [Arcicella sp.]
MAETIFGIVVLLIFILLVILIVEEKKKKKQRIFKQELAKTQAEEKRLAEIQALKIAEQKRAETIQRDRVLAEQKRLADIQAQKVAEQKRQETIQRNRILEDQKRLADIQAQKIAEQTKAENERLQNLENEKYESVLVIDAYTCNSTNTNVAVLKRKNNTYAFVNVSVASNINSHLKQTKEVIAGLNWFDETTYLTHYEQFCSQKAKIEKENYLIAQAKLVIVEQEQKEKERQNQILIQKVKEERQRQLELQAERQSQLKKQEEREKQILQDKLNKRKIQLLEKKENWREIENILKQNGIVKFYHFTDKANLQSIKTNNGLYSWDYCIKNNINVPYFGGGELSRSLDSKANLQNYVRVSFTRQHPMMYVAQKEGRIQNPIILEISLDVAYLLNTKYSDRNATKNGVRIGNDIEALNRIKFDLVKKNKHFDIENEEERSYFQAELLILEHIPIEFITNINNL